MGKFAQRPDAGQHGCLSVRLTSPRGGGVPPFALGFCVRSAVIVLVGAEWLPAPLSLFPRAGRDGGINDPGRAGLTESEYTAAAAVRVLSRCERKCCHGAATAGARAREQVSCRHSPRNGVRGRSPRPGAVGEDVRMRGPRSVSCVEERPWRGGSASASVSCLEDAFSGRRSSCPLPAASAA